MQERDNLRASVAVVTHHDLFAVSGPNCGVVSLSWIHFPDNHQFQSANYTWFTLLCFSVALLDSVTCKLLAGCQFIIERSSPLKKRHHSSSNGGHTQFSGFIDNVLPTYLYPSSLLFNFQIPDHFLSVCSGHALFKMNSTAAAPTTTGYVPEPNYGRGTLRIIWSYWTTVFLFV